MLGDVYYATPSAARNVVSMFKFNRSEKGFPALQFAVCSPFGTSTDRCLGMTDENSNERTRRRTVKEHGPDPIDRHVGNQLRIARDFNGMTQTDIAGVLGMSFQVVQKYEQGEIRVSASRLFQLATLLQRPVEYFFAGCSGQSDRELHLQRSEVELLRAYRAIQNPSLRLSIQRLAQDLCNATPDGSSGSLAS